VPPPAGTNAVDLQKHNPRVSSTAPAVSCLIHQMDTTILAASSGQDYLEISNTGTFGAPSTYPFHILAGSRNLLGLTAGTPISSSNSIVSLPIYDQTPPALNPIPPGAVTGVTFIGFLQVFINAVDGNGDMLVTVLNVTGCGKTNTAAVNQVQGSSPVPVRLITAP
jgi:hypothetical protein